MIEVHDSIVVSYTIKQIKDIIMDINAYKDFVPDCSISQVLEVRSDGSLLAELGVSIGIMSLTFVSRVVQSDDAIVSKLHKGNVFLRHLENVWRLSSENGKTHIEINSSFEIVSPYNYIVDNKLKNGLSKFTKAFVNRAEKLYGVVED